MPQLDNLTIGSLFNGAAQANAMNQTILFVKAWDYEIRINTYPTVSYHWPAGMCNKFMTITEAFETAKQVFESLSHTSKYTAHWEALGFDDYGKPRTDPTASDEAARNAAFRDQWVDYRGDCRAVFAETGSYIDAYVWYCIGWYRAYMKLLVASFDEPEAKGE